MDEITFDQTTKPDALSWLEQNHGIVGKRQNGRFLVDAGRGTEAQALLDNYDPTAEYRAKAATGVFEYVNEESQKLDPTRLQIAQAVCIAALVRVTIKGETLSPEIEQIVDEDFAYIDKVLNLRAAAKQLIDRINAETNTSELYAARRRDVAKNMPEFDGIRSNGNGQR